MQLIYTLEFYLTVVKFTKYDDFKKRYNSLYNCYTLDSSSVEDESITLVLYD